MSEFDRREEEVFEAARKLEGPALAAYLDEACADDPVLRKRVEGLLGALERAGELLGGPAVVRSPEEEGFGPSAPAQAADRIGAYRLIRKLGEGGCGMVYLADQTEPVRRQVALKILKPGLDTRQVMARFEAERQALAYIDNSALSCHTPAHDNNT
jgi:serine/threonine protein kinase